MLERHFTAERINEIVNHPSIYPVIRGHHTGPLDLSRITSNPDHICLVGEYGCVLFIKHQPGIYEFHTSTLESGRGQWMLDGAKFAFRWMFVRTDAFEIITKCPDGNIAAKAGARAVGCTQVFRTRPTWATDKGLVPVDIWSLVIQNWIKICPEIAKTGELFHEKLQEKYTKLGKIEPIHEDDTVHNQYVGATVEMLLSNQINKAIAFYNRFAAMASYLPIKLVSYDPLVIDIFEAKLIIKDGDFEVIT